MAQTTIHHGSHETIPSDASPGLVFLRDLMNAIDTLEQDPSPLPKLLVPEAKFIFNGNPPASVDQVLVTLRMRSTRLRKYKHNGDLAWDILTKDGRWTVMYEATNVLEFKEDPEGVEVKVRDFGIAELVHGDDGVWKAIEMRSFSDPSPTLPDRRLKSDC